MYNCIVLLIYYLKKCRGLHLSTTKIQALDVLLELSTYCSAETVLDRIVPYIVSKINYKCNLKKKKFKDRYLPIIFFLSFTIYF